MYLNKTAEAIFFAAGAFITLNI